MFTKEIQWKDIALRQDASVTVEADGVCLVEGKLDKQSATECNGVTVCLRSSEASSHYLYYFDAVNTFTLESASGVVRYCLLSVHPFCELLAFLDASQTNERISVDSFNSMNLPLQTSSDIKRWFVMSYLLGISGEVFERFCNMLRAKESYLLIRYLIENRCSTEKIGVLCQKYGLSYSYFRHIARRYLGESAKSKMQTWRIAQTVIDIMDNQSSITNIAFKNGFASSSHVCNTLKTTLGITPLSIRKINH